MKSQNTNQPIPMLVAVLMLAAGLLAGCSPGPAAEDDEHGHAEARGDAHDDHDHDHDHDDGDEARAVEGGAGDHGHEGAHDHDAGSEPDFAAVEPGEADRHGIRLATAGPGLLVETLSLTGRLVIDPAANALVRARFPGPVLAVTRDVGDGVARGDVLARVESNESLSTYDIRSPVAGVLLERYTNVGDVAGADPLFRVGDPSRLLAELTVFPSQQSLVKRGAAVTLQPGATDGSGVRGRVLAVVPELEGHTQALRVRVGLEEPATGLAPGQFVSALVAAGSTQAPVVIPTAALLRLEGREVVFVPEEHGFRARPVTVGRRTAGEAAITSGLAAGERYVAGGAFLLKAEIGKNLAEHSH